MAGPTSRSAFLNPPMPTHFPAHPDHHHRFRTIMRRVLAVGITTYAITTLLIPFRVPIWAVVALMAVPFLLILLINTLPWGWWRTIGWTRRIRPVLPYPLSHQHALAGGVSVLLCMTPFFTLDGDSLNIHLALPLFALGVMLLQVATRGLEIVPPACPDCAYPVHNLAFSTDSPTHCPECGFTLDSPEDATEVGHIDRPHHTYAAYALLAAAAAVFFLIPFERRDINALLPQPVLLRLAHADEVSFANLNLAALKPAQENTLTERIISARAHHRYFRIQPQLDWLANRVVTGRLTPEQTERAVNGPMTVRLVPTAPPRANQPVDLELFIDTGPIGRTVISRTYFIEHLGIDGAAAIRQDPTVRFPAHARLSAGWYLAWLMPPLNFPPQPFHSFTPTAPGPLTATVRIIAVVAPSGITTTITWNPDGSYTLTPEPIATAEVTGDTTLQIAP